MNEDVLGLILALIEAETPPVVEPIDPATAVIHEKPVWDEHWQCYEIGVSGRTTVMVMRFAFTCAVITVIDRSLRTYHERWCYMTPDKAVAAAQAWLRDGGEEPTGWHRHPTSGRRRPDGDPAKEYINP